MAASNAPVKPPQVIALKSNKSRKESTVVLFSIDGNAYSIPTEMRPNKALQIMDVMRRKGETAGVSFMLETMLGTEGYNALLNYDDLKPEDLEKIIKIASEIVAGATEAPKE